MKQTNSNITKLFALLILLGIIAPTAHARMRYFFDELDDMFEDHFAQMEDHMRQMKKHMFGFGLSKEEHKAIKEAQERLSRIKANVDSDEHNIYIRFNVEGIDKKNIKVIKKAHGFLGTIPTPDGEVEFYVTPHYLELARHVELKKEETPVAGTPMPAATAHAQGATPAGAQVHAQAELDKQQREQKVAGKKPQAVYYYSSSATEVITLPHPVDLATAHAETKDGMFTIIIPKKKEATLPISHK
jgi:HSP20 family molecular chaperone IbpA